MMMLLREFFILFPNCNLRVIFLTIHVTFLSNGIYFQEESLFCKIEIIVIDFWLYLDK